MSVLVLSRIVLIGLDLGLAPTKSSWTQVLVQKKDLIESLMEASTAETAAEQTPDMEQPPKKMVRTSLFASYDRRRQHSSAGLLRHSVQ